MIKLSFSNLFRRKTRTLLSVSGIVIGVAAIIVLVSVVDGFTLQFNDVIGQYKGIAVYEKNNQAAYLSKVDASLESEFESISYVKAAIPEIWVLPKKIDSKDISFNYVNPPMVYGLDIAKYFSSNASGWIGNVEKGSVLRQSDTGSVMIGKQIAEDFRKFVGSTIKIDGETFKIKGILEGESDIVANIIVMNLSDARELSPLTSDQVSSYTVVLTDFSKDSQVATIMRLRHEDDIDVLTQADLSEQLTGIIGNLRLLAIVVALISSVVAGIGIANTMLMSVFERFREIGALKAVGWTGDEVVKMVLLESFFLGVFGGVLGIVFGFLVDACLGAFAGVKYSITPVLVIASFLFAIALGSVAGVYPALRASKLDPIEALRG